MGIENDGPVTAAAILAAKRRIAPFVLRTPLRHSAWLSRETGADVHLKLESIQLTGSFKLRGAFNFAIQHAVGSPTEPIVTASAGNHGRALAFAAAALGLRAVIHAPETAPAAKLDAIRELGAELRLWPDYDAAEREAKRHAAGAGLPYLSPFSHPDIVAGAGTVGIEVVEDLPDVDLIVVPVGGGGLVCGVGVAAKAASRGIEMVGVEVEASHPFTTGMAAGRIVPIEVGPSLADGLVGNLDPDTITFDLARQVVDRFVLADEATLRRAVRGLVAEERLVAEGAAAVGVAVLLARRLDATGRKVAVIVTGSNIDREKLMQV